MKPAMRARQAGSMEPERRLATVLASRDVSETVSYCADYLGGVSHGRSIAGESSRTVSTRLASSFPKMIIVKEAGLEGHRPVLEKALSLLPLVKGVSETRLLAAELMLADLNQDGARTQEHERSIARMRMRVERLVGIAEASIIGLPPTASSEDGTDAKRAARRNVLELKRVMNAVYVLRSLGQDVALVARSLALIASPWGRDNPKSETGDLGTLAAGAMLSGLGLRYVCHSKSYTNIFLENRCDAAGAPATNPSILRP